MKIIKRHESFEMNWKPKFDSCKYWNWLQFLIAQEGATTKCENITKCYENFYCFLKSFFFLVRQIQCLICHNQMIIIFYLIEFKSNDFCLHYYSCSNSTSAPFFSSNRIGVFFFIIRYIRHINVKRAKYSNDDNWNVNVLMRICNLSDNVIRIHTL